MHDRLTEIVSGLRGIRDTAEATFAPLSDTQLCWSAAPARWSIGQCLEHLIASNEQYFPVLDRLASSDFKPGFWERFSPFSRGIGESMIRNLGADSGKRYKAPRLFLPQRPSPRAGVTQLFLVHQDELIRRVAQLDAVALDQRVVSSPVSGLITFPAYAMLRILLVHEERHLQQAARVMREERFPVK